MPEINPAVMEQKAGLAFQYAGGAFISGVIYIGDKLGIYRAMKDTGPLTSAAVAQRTNLNERFVREWLYQQTAAGIVDRCDGDRFELGPEAGLVFADESTPAALIGLFGELPTLMEIMTSLAPKAFQTGLGATYDSFGERGAHFIDRFLGVWNRTSLVPEALPKISGLVEKLKAGAKVADVGCGAGAGPIAIAAAFPNADVHGFDNSLNAGHYIADWVAEVLGARTST